MKGDLSADIRAACDRARAETEARIDKEIAGSGVNNPYTGQPFSGVAEFLAYGRRLQADIRAAEARKAQMEEEASAQTEPASERSCEERSIGSTASAKSAG